MTVESIVDSLRGKIGEADTGKRDYRHRSRTGCVENRWLSTCGSDDKSCSGSFSCRSGCEEAREVRPECGM